MKILIGLMPVVFAGAVSAAPILNTDMNVWLKDPYKLSSVVGGVTYVVNEGYRGLTPVSSMLNHGGDAYELKGMYTSQTNTTLSYAILGGISPSNNDWPLTTIAFDIGSNGSFEYGLLVKNTRYGIAGDLFSVNPSTGWAYGQVAPDNTGVRQGTGDRTIPVAFSGLGLTKINSGIQTYFGAATFNSATSIFGTHLNPTYSVNTIFDKRELNLMPGESLTTNIAMLCGNDWLKTTITNNTNVPEPTSMALFGIAGFGYIVSRKRKVF